MNTKPAFQRLASVAILTFIAGCSGLVQSPPAQMKGADHSSASQVRSGSSAPSLSNAASGAFPNTRGPARSIDRHLGGAVRSNGSHYPKKGALLFVTIFDPPSIGVYSGVKQQALKLEATITNSVYTPQQIATDSDGTLYVSSALGDYLTTFPNGATVPTNEISDGLTEPFGVVIDSADTLYVSNQYPPSVVVYPKGSISPSAIITSSDFGILLGEALDSSGNLYVADDVKHQIFEIPKGTTTVKNLFLEGLSDTSCSNPYGPVGVAFDKRDRLYVSCTEGNRILVYKLPKVAPIATLTTGMNEPYMFSFDAKSVLYLANYGVPNVEALAPPAYTQVLTTLPLSADPVGAYVRRKR
jgi:hypothetical protein